MDNNIIKKFNEIKINKSSIFTSLLVLFLSSIIFVVPFIHCLTITNFTTLLLAMAGFGVFISGIIMLSLLIFYKTQTFLIGKTFAGFTVPLLFIFSAELILLSIISFLTMLNPPLFLIIGAISFTFTCGLNIITMYKMLDEYSLSTSNLLKSIKIYNIAILGGVVCLWLII